MKRDFQIRFLKEADLEPHHYILDLGCGTLRGGIPLIEYLEEAHYYGVEQRSEVLDEGREELLEAGLQHKHPTLLVSSDISQIKLDQKFDFIWAFSVLIHMDDHILDGALGFVDRHLRNGGVFFANVNIGSGVEGHWQGFPVVCRTLDFYREACAKHGLTVTDLGPLKDLGHVSNIESQDSQRMLKISRNIGESQE